MVEGVTPQIKTAQGNPVSLLLLSTGSPDVSFEWSDSLSRYESVTTADSIWDDGTDWQLGSHPTPALTGPLSAVGPMGEYEVIILPGNFLLVAEASYPGFQTKEPLGNGYTPPAPEPLTVEETPTSGAVEAAAAETVETPAPIEGVTSETVEAPANPGVVTQEVTESPGSPGAII